MSEIRVSILRLENATTGKPTNLALYAWFRNGVDGVTVNRIFDTFDGTWVSEDMTAHEAVQAIIAQGRTFTPGFGVDLPIDELDNLGMGSEHGDDVLFQIVKTHASTCKCPPCVEWDIRQTER